MAAMNVVHTNSHEQCAVVTCYCTTAIGINTLVFSDGTTHSAGGFAAHMYPEVPIVVASHQHITPGHKFFGVAIGAVDHGYVAVAISGVCTVSCSNKDLVDAYPTDLLQIGRSAGKSSIWVNHGSSGPIHFDTCKLVRVEKGDAVVGKDVVGVLVAHGRNPADEAKILLLPGLEHLPPAPDDITMDEECDDGSPDASNSLLNTAVAHDFSTNPYEAVQSMTIAQLAKVSIPSDLSFRQELGTFLEMVVDLARANPNNFRTAVE